MTQQPSFVAENDLAPSVCVKIGTSDHRVDLAGVGDKPAGIAHEGTQEAPIPGITPLVAKAGQGVRVYGDGDTCEGIAGAAIAVDDYLKPDANGHLIPASGVDWCVGQAVAAANIGDQVRLTVRILQLGGT